MIAKKAAEWKPEKLDKGNNNMYRIIGIIDGHYIVQTPKGLKTEGPESCAERVSVLVQELYSQIKKMYVMK